MKKEKYLLSILGILFLIVPLFLNFYNLLRLISCILGIIILIITNSINNKKWIVSSLIILVVATLSLYGLDFISARLFKTYPIMAIEYKSSDKMKIYDAIFYRVYDCDSIRTFDKGYKKEYVCNKELLNKVDVNTLLENPKDAYKTNLNKFIRIQGKITKIVGNSEIELNSYTSEESLNGYAVFDNNKIVVLEDLNIDPKEYYIYDTIEVVGRVKSFSKKDDINKITLTDVKVYKSDIYNDYELVVSNIKTSSKVKVEEGIYFIGLEGIYYKYDENNIYSIDYLLKDKRVIIDDLIKGIESKEVNANNDKIYELDKYNVIICKNKDIIFASKNIKNLEEICNVEE